LGAIDVAFGQAGVVLIGGGLALLVE